MEELLPRAGIHHFGRFRCGFNIRTEQAAVMHEDPRGPQYKDQLCALDWYCQSPSDRLSEPDTWDHYLLLDQVSPTKYFMSKSFRRMGRYVGWRDMPIGGAWGYV